MMLLTAKTELDPRQKEIFSFCETYLFAHENPALVVKNSRIYIEGYDPFGLDEQQLSELRDEVLDRFDPSVCELAD